MTQFSRFSTGGYVLHKVTLDGTQGRFSAWFDKDGKLLDAEQFDRLNRTRPVQRDGPTWRALQRVGQRYLHAPSDHGQPVRRDEDGHMILENPARMKASIASFDDANRFYESSRYPHKLGHNTHVFRVVDDGMRAAAIQYHKTFIVIYRDDGTIKLDSGGYQTVSTKSHMNSVLPPGIGVFQKKHDWFVSVRGTDVPFYDGMVIYGYANNPMRRPQKGDDLDAMGYPGHDLREAQAIYDRAHRKTAEPDPRARMLAEQRRRPVGGTTMKDYRKAIREPLPGAHISGVTARTQQIAAAYPLDIWREGGPRWEGPFKIMGKGASRVFQVLARADTVEEAIAAAPAFSAQHWADVEVWDKHDIAIAAMTRVRGTPSHPAVRDRMEYLGNPDGDEPDARSEFQRYTSPGERGAATRLVREAIKRGYRVSVFDGQEWTVKQSTASREILNALATTGEDQLKFRRRPGDVATEAKEVVGVALLIWGNDPSGEELIADYTDNADMRSLVEVATRQSQG